MWYKGELIKAIELIICKEPILPEDILVNTHITLAEGI